MKRQKIVVAMSGGVDSSVAAHLAKEAGFEVIGITLKTWPKELCDTIPKQQTCCSVRDIEDAREVADQLEIPFYVVEASSAFKAQVMEPFVRQYARGFTPNPCVVCNRQIKLGILLAKAKALGAEFVATGHYARVGQHGGQGRLFLRRAVDETKDQSYVLFQLSQEQLSHLILPIGEKTKGEIRQIASRLNLKVADKPDSMELCFIPDGDTQGFLRQRAPEGFLPGPIVDRQGRVLGSHQGIAAYTVGQRKGLGIAHPKPLYVLGLDPQGNRVIVGEQEDLKATACEVVDLHWVSIEGISGPLEGWVKVRYRADPRRATLLPRGDRVRVEFHEPMEGGVSPGQAAVFYEGDLLLGGGWICRGLST